MPVGHSMQDWGNPEDHPGDGCGCAMLVGLAYLIAGMSGVIDGCAERVRNYSDQNPQVQEERKDEVSESYGGASNFGFNKEDLEGNLNLTDNYRVMWEKKE